ncbi:hypothetical protein MC885_020179 [Smutsia gigantea]|nr:hypothetical protein MC885_020179 [Smutsia gigantea]
MMKLKSNQTRTYDGDGYKKRAACLCFRSESEEELLEPTRLDREMINIEDPQWAETLVALVFVSENAPEDQVEGVTEDHTFHQALESALRHRWRCQR